MNVQMNEILVLGAHLLKNRPPFIENHKLGYKVILRTFQHGGFSYFLKGEFSKCKRIALRLKTIAQIMTGKTKRVSKTEEL